MKKIYWGLLFAGVCAMAFSGGVLAGVIKSKVKEKPTEPVAESVKAVISEEETVPDYADESVYYIVRTEGDYIILATVSSSGTETEIERAQINKKVLPVEDVELLEEGLTFDVKDEALMMIENFVS